jgi:hypothetical protein
MLWLALAINFSLMCSGSTHSAVTSRFYNVIYDLWSMDMKLLLQT